MPTLPYTVDDGHGARIGKGVAVGGWEIEVGKDRNDGSVCQSVKVKNVRVDTGDAGCAEPNTH